MPPPPATSKQPPPPDYQPLPALLSYLIPGLGQIYQGRILKGVLFLVCIYGLFFYGMALGQGKNVYLPHTSHLNNPMNWPPLAANLYNRPQFLGQFWVGVAAWPAVLQYVRYDPRADRDRVLGTFQRQPEEQELNALQIRGDKTWDLAWVYTVIAGVLNVLVIYDALAGPAFHVEPEAKPTTREAQAA